MSIQVVTVTSRIPCEREPYYRYGTWLKSLQRLGVEPTVLGMNEPWYGLMTKPKRMREWLRAGNCKADLCLWTDSFDVVFAAHPDEIEQRYLKLWAMKPVLFNAERGLWPRTDLADWFPECGTPWRYLNCGLMLAPPVEILKALEWMPLDDIPGDTVDPHTGKKCEPNDQAWWQLVWSARPTAMNLDTHCDLFQSCSACSAEDFLWTGERFRNMVTGPFPLVWHFNGNSKDLLLPDMLKKWGLE